MLSRISDMEDGSGSQHNEDKEGTLQQPNISLRLALIIISTTKLRTPYALDSNISLLVGICHAGPSRCHVGPRHRSCVPVLLAWPLSGSILALYSDILYESPITNLCDVAPMLLLRGPIGPHFAG